MMSSEMICDEAIGVDDCEEDKEESAYVTIRDDETGVEVRAPYIRDMVAWDYLSNVIRPSVGLRMDEAGVSVSGRVWYGEQKDEFGLYSPQMSDRIGANSNPNSLGAKEMKKKMVNEPSDCHDEEDDEDVLMLSCFGGGENDGYGAAYDGSEKAHADSNTFGDVFGQACGKCWNAGYEHVTEEW